MSLAADAIPAKPTVESIQLLIDQNGSPGGRRPYASRRNIARILWDLIEQGPAESDSGQATNVLKLRLGALEPSRVGDAEGLGTGFSAQLRQLEDWGLIAREVGGKRTYRITATVAPATLTAAGYDRAYCGTVPRRAEPLSLIGETEPDTEPEPALIISEQWVTEPKVDTDGLAPVGYLIEAVRLISQAIPMTMIPAAIDPNPEVLDRLATTLADNERLRRKLAQLGDELHATKQERDGLRKAKTMLEHNLSDMAKGALNEQHYRRFVELDRLVRSAPGSTKGD